jgi:cyclic pyranopterin phosphate synthase
MPEEGIDWTPHGNILSYEDIFFLIEALKKLGVKKIRFTGGEPLARRGIVPFLERVCASFPGIRFVLTTNGATLKPYAAILAQSGLSGINVSLDTLDPDKFAFMTRGGKLQSVLDGIEALVSARDLAEAPKMELKMNVVLIRGFNDALAPDLANFAFQRRITPRFIEFMPLDPGVWSKDNFVPFEEILARLSPGDWREEKEEGGCVPSFSGPARYYSDSATGRRIGFISAVSRHFCSSCNRLRVTSTGEVRPCLFNDKQVPLRDALRARDEEKTCERLRAAAELKPAGLDEASNSDESTPEARSAGRMYKIGG